ncbi:MAG: hypothetical protein JO114_22775 [Planctomycetaceae bacterium]|nr:hypothetical protein [Planctomycetaceae bacterium]MBV8312557.1 hypothetical protein [Planctomycetaceae bacterium]
MVLLERVQASLAAMAVDQDDSRLDLVAVLASWTGTAGPAKVAFASQRIGIEPGGMEPVCIVRLRLPCDRVMRAHDVYRPENGNTPQLILAMFQNSSRPVVRGDGMDRTRHNALRLAYGVALGRGREHGRSGNPFCSFENSR